MWRDPVDALSLSSYILQPEPIAVPKKTTLFSKNGLIIVHLLIHLAITTLATITFKVQSNTNNPTKNSIKAISNHPYTPSSLVLPRT
ncbi:hypothetical protein JAAARDRAFT_400974 [Jaapia argillacea MUCL 33604]|uniref:Uncharacterized protein n=1 Tax=Jaapia argillacea MUCL 33604 TaxID=933084 RepID=A0A067PIN2_9AGAM|nr:hypothetical protein JAAARDRAFT_400974 [Jaapia argillacea MUCL 33604]